MYSPKSCDFIQLEYTRVMSPSHEKSGETKTAKTVNLKFIYVLGYGIKIGNKCSINFATTVEPRFRVCYKNVSFKRKEWGIQIFVTSFIKLVWTNFKENVEVGIDQDIFDNLVRKAIFYGSNIQAEFLDPTCELCNVILITSAFIFF